MGSLNNIFILAEIEEPFKKYTKTVDYVVTGWRLDTDGRQVEFILESPTETFDYEQEVLEIYSEREDKFFRQRNRRLFEKGLIKEFTGEPETVDETNFLTDAEVNEIATIRSSEELKNELNALTSRATVLRIQKAAKEIGRPARIMKVIDTRLSELLQ